jgi:hypothetical protein
VGIEIIKCCYFTPGEGSIFRNLISSVVTLPLLQYINVTFFGNE